MEKRRITHTPFILAHRRQRQVDLWEFEDSLVYMSRTRAAKAPQ